MQTVTKPVRDRDAALRARASAVVPGGMYGHLNAGRMPAAFPQFFARAEGCHLWDVDGNEYVDLMCSWGPILLGHRHPKVEEAVDHQRRLGDTLNGPGEVMVDLAETLVDRIAHADWMLFAKNGTDATTVALMVARATTGRSRILTARGSYHGSAPWCTPVVTGTIPSDRSAMVPFEYNDTASFDAAVEAAGSDVAGVIVTPFRHDAGFDQELATPEFARHLRAVCDRLGAALILDDVRCGLRLGEGGSWEALGVAPDLSTWSKAIANGYPLSALAGNDAYRDGASRLFVTGSFWMSAVPMAAALATLAAHREEGAVERMVRAGTRLRTGLDQQAAAHGVAVLQTGPVQMPYMTFVGDVAHERAQVFASAALEHGAYLHPTHNWFLSGAHTDRDIDAVLNATDHAFRSVREQFGQS